ncbi:hypothetical protein [Lentzea jiangxiensis]|uniref:hypothetical protein n=1 Tax=Lentzea jiangxiensis TaxID=641025 RepID=UPI0015A2D217|nr:hypothetical protein [Lentzea jiangxiensis]
MSAKTLVLNLKILPLDLYYDRVGFAVVRATQGVHAEFTYRATYEKQLIDSNRQWTVSGRSPPSRAKTPSGIEPASDARTTSTSLKTFHPSPKRPVAREPGYAGPAA